MVPSVPLSEQPVKLSWRFPRTFWFANVAELFERAAYYGMFIALTLYLTERIGFDDVWTGYVGAAFASVLYLLPTFSGILADRIGFRRALLLAFALLALGYALLGVAGLPRADGPLGAVVPSAASSPAPFVPLFATPVRKFLATVALALAMLGGSIIKPVITGTVAKCSGEATRARAFSIFYAMVNIGSFTGKSFAKPLRTGFTVPGTDLHLSLGLEYINFYAALMAGLGLVLVALAYRNVDGPAERRTYAQAWAGLCRVMRNFRFIALILIVAGFWSIQHQLYATMPKYIIRLIGNHASPEWLANVNPAVVVLLVVPITHLVRRFQAANSILISLGLITLSAATVSMSAVLQAAAGTSISVAGIALHPITLAVIVGIALQGLAECFLSPKFLEFASKQAPPGETGLYMGYAHLSSFFAYFLAFVISGHLLDALCPDPATLSPDAQAQWRAATVPGATTPLPAPYARAHYIWYVFTCIGVTAFLALLAFKYVTARLDRRRAAA
jgi:dipeptide/tripeptide permease